MMLKTKIKQKTIQIGRTFQIIHMKLSDIDNICLHVKDPYEIKNQTLVNKREILGSEKYGYLKAFIEYSNDIQDAYKNIE